MTSVGIIANPAAGKDIRRLVAHGRVVPNQEKVNILKRIFAGLDAVGVRDIVMMPDVARLGNGALDGTRFDPDRAESVDVRWVPTGSRGRPAKSRRKYH